MAQYNNRIESRYVHQIKKSAIRKASQLNIRNEQVNVMPLLQMIEYEFHINIQMEHYDGNHIKIGLQWKVLIHVMISLIIYKLLWILCMLILLIKRFDAQRFTAAETSIVQFETVFTQVFRWIFYAWMKWNCVFVHLTHTIRKYFLLFSECFTLRSRIGISTETVFDSSSSMWKY